MDPKEEWRSIPEFSKYEITNYGLVYSVTHQCLLSLRPDEAGYFRIELMGDDGVMRAVRVHVLVMATFVGPKPLGMSINHKNGVKNDNRLTNLEYITHSENTLHAYRNGLRKPLCGDNNALTKIPDAEIPKIKKLYATGKYTMKEIGQMYGVSKTPIMRIMAGKRKTASTSP